MVNKMGCVEYSQKYFKWHDKLREGCWKSFKIVLKWVGRNRILAVANPNCNVSLLRVQTNIYPFYCNRS